MSVLVGNNNDLSKSSEEAAMWLILDIEWRSKEEQDNGQEHKSSRNTKTQFPSKVVLCIDQSGQGDNNGESLRSIVPTDEAL